MSETAADEYLIEGGHVLTPEFEVREADVLIDRAAGEVMTVDDDLAGDIAADETLDATGSLVMPGLVNAHTHVAMTLLRGYADDKQLDAWLQEDIWPVEAELTPDDIRVGTELGLVEFITNGITGYADAYFEVGEIAAATPTPASGRISATPLLRSAKTTKRPAPTPRRASLSPASSRGGPTAGSRPR
jgi:Cytosine deaminase and related metal-dependent hydrolases